MAGIGINGFGRIGRVFLREALSRQNVQVLAINEFAMDPKHIAYLLQYDSMHGIFKKKITIDGNKMIVCGQVIQLMKELDPKKICWKELGVTTVVDCTGKYLTLEKAQAHLDAGAKKVFLSAASDDAPMLVCGVNLDKYKPDMKVISNASCTVNGLAPLAKVVHENFEIVEGLMSTVHAVTPSQLILDGSKELWRNGRCGMCNIIPSTTGVAMAIGKVLPDLNGKLTGLAFRVPTANVSVVDLTCRLGRGAKMEQISAVIKEAANGKLKGIIGYTEDEVVSTDFNGSRYSTIFDAKACIALNDNFVKLISWYDNEIGYSCRLLDLVIYCQIMDKCATNYNKINDKSENKTN